MEKLLALFAFSLQGYVLYLVRGMIKFAKDYGKPWAFAFKVFFVAMTICLARRGAVILVTFGMDSLKDALVWYDRYVSNPVLTVLYMAFLLLLLRWWKGFFEQLHATILSREKAVTKREEDVAIREKCIEFREPNGVDIDEPRQVVISLDDKRIVAMQPKKVVVTKVDKK